MLRFLFTFLILLSVPASAWAESSIQTAAKQAIIVDYETGMTLYEKNADMKMPTSSMSKVMTIYMVFDALKKGNISLDDSFTVSEKAWRKGGSKMFVEVDKKVKVEALIQGVIVQSGNDATIVLAEGLAASEDAFADGMNIMAQQLGMKNSHFMNASGWPDPDHYSTARDLATLGIAMIRNFPKYYPYYSEKEFTYNDITQKNRNPLLYRDIGADGIKTGHTEAGGYGLMGSGTLNGRRVVLVVNGLENEKQRAQESAKLLQWGLKHFENRVLFKAGQPIENVEIVIGKKAAVPAVLKEDLKVSIPKTATHELKVTAHLMEPLVAPVAEGQEVGRLTIEAPNIEPIERPLYAGASVEKLGFFAATIAKAKLSSRGGYVTTNE